MPVSIFPRTWCVLQRPWVPGGRVLVHAGCTYLPALPQCRGLDHRTQVLLCICEMVRCSYSGMCRHWQPSLLLQFACPREWPTPVLLRNLDEDIDLGLPVWDPRVSIAGAQWDPRVSIAGAQWDPRVSIAGKHSWCSVGPQGKHSWCSVGPQGKHSWCSVGPQGKHSWCSVGPQGKHSWCSVID